MWSRRFFELYFERGRRSTGEGRSCRGKSIVVGWLAFVALSGWPIGAMAATDAVLERSLEELTRTGLVHPPKNVEISTAAKFPQSADDAPTAVYVVTAEDIRTFGYRTLAEILHGLPGLYTTGDHQYTYLGARGFGLPGDYNTRVLILLDGERVNESGYDSALVGSEFPLDVDLIERVEYVPGPGSAIYGNNAFFGVVNVITRRGRTFDGGEFSAGYGSFDTYKARASYGKRFDGVVDLLLSATRVDRDGPKHPYYWQWTLPEQDGGAAEGLDYDRTLSLFGKVSHGPLTLEAGYLDRSNGFPAVGDGVIFDRREGNTKDRRSFLMLRYDDQIAPAWGLYLRLGYNRYGLFGTYPPLGPSTPESPLPAARDATPARWWGGEIRLTNTQFDRHRLVAGAEWQNNYRLSVRFYVPPDPPLMDFSYRFSRYGLYLQDEIRLGDSLTLLAGVRHDTSPFGNSTNPRLGVIWHPLDTTTLKLLYGTAFRTPSFFEYWTTAFLLGEGPNPNLDILAAGLRPEEIETLQFGLEHYLTPSTRLAASLYRYQMDDLLNQGYDAATGDTYFFNLGQVTGHGLEVEAEQRFANGLRGKLSYSLQHSETAQGSRLPNSPRHMLKFQLSAPLWDERWRLGLETLYVSGRDTLAGHVGAYALGNLILTGDLGENAGVSLGFYNIGNSRYADPANPIFGLDAIEQDGFNFQFKLNLGF